MRKFFAAILVFAMLVSRVAADDTSSVPADARPEAVVVDAPGGGEMVRLGASDRYVTTAQSDEHGVATVRCRQEGAGVENDKRAAR